MTSSCSSVDLLGSAGQRLPSFSHCCSQMVIHCEFSRDCHLAWVSHSMTLRFPELGMKEGGRDGGREGERKK